MPIINRRRIVITVGINRTEPFPERLLPASPPSECISDIDTEHATFISVFPGFPVAIQVDLHFDIHRRVSGRKMTLPEYSTLCIRRHCQGYTIHIEQRVCDWRENVLYRIVHIRAFEPEQTPFHLYRTVVLGAKVRGSREKEKWVLQLYVLLIGTVHFITYGPAEEFRPRDDLRRCRPAIGTRL